MHYSQLPTFTGLKLVRVEQGRRLGKMETLNIGFRKDQLSESVRENFVGVVVYAEFPCDCVICKRGNEKLRNMGRGEIPRIHLVIKPLTVYEKLQHAWYPTSKIIWSNFGAFVIALNDVLGFYPDGQTAKEQWESIKEYLMNHAFEWTSMKSVDFVSQVTRKEVPSRLPDTLLNARENWFPIHEYSKEEVKKMYNVDLDEVLEQGKKEVEELFEQIEAEEEFFNEKLDEIDQIDF